MQLAQFLVFCVHAYRWGSIPRVLRVSNGLCWGPPHDGQKSVPSELQEARFADQISRRHFSDFPGSLSGLEHSIDDPLSRIVCVVVANPWIFTYVPIDLCQFLVFYVCSYTSAEAMGPNREGSSQGQRKWDC